MKTKLNKDGNRLLQFIYFIIVFDLFNMFIYLILLFSFYFHLFRLLALYKNISEDSFRRQISVISL
jgi:hypothetical protein